MIGTAQTPSNNLSFQEPFGGSLAKPLGVSKKTMTMTKKMMKKKMKTMMRNIKGLLNKLQRTPKNVNNSKCFSSTFVFMFLMYCFLLGA